LNALFEYIKEIGVTTWHRGGQQFSRWISIIIFGNFTFCCLQSVCDNRATNQKN